LSSEYDLLPKLARLSIPTLVIHGDYDFVPVECAAHISQAIPGARFALLKDCGHFSYLERPDEVREALADFFHNT
jgi:proline iminopeptidase